VTAGQVARSAAGAGARADTDAVTVGL